MKQEKSKKTDEVLLQVIESVAKKHARDDQLAGSPPSLELALPVPSLAVQYLLQNSGLILGLVYHLTGIPASFKTTLLAELMRWHLSCGGYGILCETETKPTPELRKSILGYEEKRVIVRECVSIEQWQKTIVDYLKALKKEFEANPSEAKPIIFGVDSYMGKMPQRLQEKFAKQGFAEKHFGEAAQIIGDWLSVYTALVKSWPFTLVGVNHLKKSIDPVTGIPSYRTPGGQFLQHQNVTELRVSRSKTERLLAGDKPYYETVIQLQTSKNSRGAQDKKIAVTLRQWREVVDGESRLFSVFEWWEAVTRILFDGWGLAASEKEILVPKIKKILNVQRRARGDLFWCSELGVSKDDPIKPHELGLMVAQNEEVSKELRIIFDVTEIPLFEEKSLESRTRLSDAESSDKLLENPQPVEDENDLVV